MLAELTSENKISYGEYKAFSSACNFSNISPPVEESCVENYTQVDQSENGFIWAANSILDSKEENKVKGLGQYLLEFIINNNATGDEDSYIYMDLALLFFPFVIVYILYCLYNNYKEFQNKKVN